MICDVVLTQKDKKFIARVCQYPEITAEDDSEEAVLTAACLKLNKLLSNSRIVKINIETECYEHPLLRYAGMFSSDLHWENFQELIGKYRKEIDTNMDLEPCSF